MMDRRDAYGVLVGKYVIKGPLEDSGIDVMTLNGLNM
jgi:hypothetical protein